MSPIFRKSTGPVALKGRDYTVRSDLRSDGALVFTREYLLARGTCCQSKCLNCPYGYSRENPATKAMRPVISMVPSWTETLVAARAYVVGRTRFCIHPHDSLQAVTVLGGTKTLASDASAKIMKLIEEHPGKKPLVILDKEENPKEFYEFFAKLGCDIEVTHVSDFSSLSASFEGLSRCFSSGAPSQDDLRVSSSLEAFAKRSRALSHFETASDHTDRTSSFGGSLIESTVAESALVSYIQSNAHSIFYFIWKKPWMIVRADTWIGEVFARRFHMVPKLTSLESLSKYPEVTEDEIPSDSILLFSSEPYPFHREWNELVKSDLIKRSKAAAIVDGEAYSWFGIRALRFLEEHSKTEEF